MSGISKLVKGIGPQGWAVAGAAVLCVGVLAILYEGPPVVPCLAITLAGFAFRGAIFLRREDQRPPVQPWLSVEHPPRRK